MRRAVCPSLKGAGGENIEGDQMTDPIVWDELTEVVRGRMGMLKEFRQGKDEQ